MSVQDIIALVSAVIAAGALALAIFKYVDDRRRKTTERERLAYQEERLATAARAAWDARHATDLLVQRSKASGVTDEEIRNIGRIIRGNLESLAKQLEGDAEKVKVWRDPSAYTSQSRVTTPTGSVGGSP